MNINNLLSREGFNSSRFPVMNVSESTNNESIATGSLGIGDGRSWTLPRQEEQELNISQERNVTFTSLQKSKMMESFPIKVCLPYCNLPLLLFPIS